MTRHRLVSCLALLSLVACIGDLGADAMSDSSMVAPARTPKRTAADGGTTPTTPAAPAPPTPIVGTPITADRRVPVTLAAGADGRAYPTVDIRLGDGAVLHAVVDTSTSGLFVLAGAVDVAALAPDGAERETATYDDTTWTGSVARAKLTVGDVLSPEAVPFVVVDDVQCVGAACAAPSYPGSFQAVLGIGLRTMQHTIVRSPLLQLGGATGRFVLRGFGAVGSTGELTLEPGAAVVARFTPTIAQMPAATGATLPGGPAFDDRRVPFCVNELCGTALLDSASPATRLLVTSAVDYLALGVVAGEQLPVGTNVAMSVNSIPLTRYVVGPDAGAPIELVDTVPEHRLGERIFAECDVLYDAYAGKIGVVKN